MIFHWFSIQQRMKALNNLGYGVMENNLIMYCVFKPQYKSILGLIHIWRPPNLSGLTPY